MIIEYCKWQELWVSCTSNICSELFISSSDTIQSWHTDILLFLVILWRILLNLAVACTESGWRKWIQYLDKISWPYVSVVYWSYLFSSLIPANIEYFSVSPCVLYKKFICIIELLPINTWCWRAYHEILIHEAEAGGNWIFSSGQQHILIGKE